MADVKMGDPEEDELEDGEEATILPVRIPARVAVAMGFLNSYVRRVEQRHYCQVEGSIEAVDGEKLGQRGEAAKAAALGLLEQYFNGEALPDEFVVLKPRVC